MGLGKRIAARLKAFTDALEKYAHSRRIWPYVRVYLSQHGQVSGRDLRDMLSQDGIKIGPVPFYTAMARFEDEGAVSGFWQEGDLIGTRSRAYALKSSDGFLPKGGE